MTFTWKTASRFDFTPKMEVKINKTR